MIPVDIFNGYEDGLTRDAHTLQVPEFTVRAIVEAMEARGWAYDNGRLFAALRKGDHPYGVSLLVFRIAFGVRGELVT